MENSMQKLSPEVLASCFRFLGWQDLIAASHVSHFWRSSALAFPDLWTQISLYGPRWASSYLVHMAMSRAGQRVVHFEHRAPEQFAEGMAQAISQHMHRFRSIKCAYSLYGVETCRPAPLLREFVCDGLRFHVRPGFLGGSTSTGSLRTLLLAEAIFPPVCQALSALTSLRATFPVFYDGDAGFRYIFELCPRLETLELDRLTGNPGVVLPAGPAPRTLRDVTLHSERDCDLVELYTVWALEAVRDVLLDISMNEETNHVNLASFLAGATDVSLTFNGEYPDLGSPARIVAKLPRAFCRTYLCDSLAHALDPVGVLAGMLQAPQLRVLTIPLDVLARAAPLQPWPHLVHLCIHIYETNVFSSDTDSSDTDSSDPDDTGEHHPTPRFRWTDLECLRVLPALEALELRLRPSWMSDAPTLADAQELKACLASLRDYIPREVQVHGFPADVMPEMPIRDGDEPRVVLH